MKVPLVSIIITTKNEEKNIERLLKSIEKQTYSKIETLVVDNGSSDNTKELVRKYTKKVYEKGPERSAQRNFGATKANGVYYLFLDADMELEKDVVKSCVNTVSNSDAKAVIIPEKTTGDNFIAKIRRFERDMYKGDSTIEVARFFPKKVFNEMGGYDETLTGAEDYDLPHRVMKKYKVGWANEYLIHHEGNLTLKTLLKKKYYYAKNSVAYADKHPELIARQGTIILRKAYLRNWRKFVKNPLLGISFLAVRFLVTISAILGYIKEAGFRKFFRTFLKMFTK